MKGIKLYLAGPMSVHYLNNEYDKATKWREELTDKLIGQNAYLYKFFNPAVNAFKSFKTDNKKTVLSQNKHYLENCDIMILNLDSLDRSPGSLYELFYYEKCGKPVIAFGESEWTKNPHIYESIDVILDDVDDVVEYILYYYNQ